MERARPVSDADRRPTTRSQTVVAARRLRDAKVVFIGVGRPSTAALLARMVINPRPRARLRVGDDRRQAVPRSRCRSATASWPRPPTRSCRCPRCSTTGSGPGRIDVAFLGAAQVDRFAQPQLDRDRRLRPPQDAPARRRRRARDRRELRRGDRDRRAAHQAHVRRAARLPHDGRLRRRARVARAARLPRPRADGGDHRPRRARARPRHAASWC